MDSNRMLADNMKEVNEKIKNKEKLSFLNYFYLIIQILILGCTIFLTVMAVRVLMLFL